MKQIIYDSYDQLSEESALMIAGIIINKPDALISLPSGETSLGTFEHLVRLNKSGKFSFSRCRLVGLDEWAGLGNMKKENCYSFMKTHLFDMIDYTEGNLCFFDGESSDTQGECVRTDEFIRQYGPIDVIVLGIGMNGHLGLNEPGISFNLYSHVTELDNVTRIVAQKYFSARVDLRKGLTLGIKHIQESRRVILQIAGKRKAAVAKRLIDSEVTNLFPASIIKNHPDSWLLIDREAAEYI